MPETGSATILLSGDVASTDFPVWIARYAHKLGLIELTLTTVPAGLSISAQGPYEMLWALALGASLGPESVLVEKMTFTTDAGA